MITTEIKPQSKADLLKHKALVEEFLQESTFELSAFSFINIFIWSDFFDFKFQVVDGNLGIFAHSEPGHFLYLPPLGRSISKRAITECFTTLCKLNNNSSVSRIENVDRNQWPQFDLREFARYQKGNEYVYRREEIAALNGNKFKSKRSSYNHFVKHYRFEYLPFSFEMREECEALYASWAQDKKNKNTDPIYRQMLEDNRGVHRLALRYHQELGLIGRVVKVDGKIKAYSFGYVLKEDVFCVLFEIADTDVKGLPVFIFSELCKDKEVRRFEWINCMDDFEMEKIAMTKKSFHPVRVHPCYTVTRKNS